MGGSNTKTSCSNFYALRCPCPAVNCGSSTVHSWAHTVCGTQVYINSEADLKCSSHGVYCSIVDARWSCDKHQGDYRKGDVEALIHALTIAGSFYQTQEKVWASKLITSVIRLR